MAKRGRNPYINYISEIKGLRQARNKNDLVDFVRRKANTVNSRLRLLEKKNIGLNESAYRYAKMETGKEKPRYSTNKNKLNQMTEDQLYELALQLNQKLISKTSTPAGLEEIEERRFSLASEKLSEKLGTAIDSKKLKKFIEDGGDFLLNSKYLSSTHIIDVWEQFTENTGISNKEFIREFKRYSSLDRVDWGKIRRNLINLKNRKRKR